MRDARFFTAAMAAALASLLGLGPGAAAEIEIRPQAYQAQLQGGAPLPVWLVRYKLRQLGYQDIYRVRAEDDGYAALAHDHWGRHVKLFVDSRTGEVVPRAGYGLARLRPDDVQRHLEALGYQCLTPVVYRDEHYQVIARGRDGARRTIRVDPVTGAAWS